MKRNPDSRIVARGEGVPAPLTIAQEHRIAPPDTVRVHPNAPRWVGNVSVAFALDPGLDAAAMERAVREFAIRQSALRTAFRFDERWSQQVVPLTFEPLEIIDCDQREALLPEVVTRPFDRTNGDVFKVTLLRSRSGKATLVLCADHLIADGWSMEIATKELSCLYEACVIGETAALPGLPYEFADYAAWQRASLAGDSFSRVITFWRDHLRDLPAGPDSGLKPALPLHELTSRDVRVDYLSLDGLARQLRAVVAARRGTLFVALAGAAAATMSRMTGRQTVPLIAYFANRSDPHRRNIVGWLSTTLLLSFTIPARATSDTLFEQARRIIFSALQHDQLPFVALIPFLPGAFARYHDPTPTLVVGITRPDSNLTGTHLNTLNPVPLPTSPHSLNVGRIHLFLEDDDRHLRLLVEAERGRYDDTLLMDLLGGTAHELRCLVEQ